MESARTEYWLKTFGGQNLIDLNFIVVHAECDFKKPAHFGNEIEVTIRTSSIGNSSFVWDYEIKDAKSGELFAAGKTIQVFYDHKALKSSPVPAEIRDKLISR
jgi:acyl-CoA thioester hydrolase